ncbi:hypothetical protein ACWDSJ_18410 [Nocardia sp. NPDC003482]|uniref:hypothetical protein n=1 Tax=Nocardia sp. NPDC004068 TaxID=3364303 RepID=UPI0036C7C051
MNRHASAGVLTLDTAHLIWQEHRRCNADDCPRKAEALAVLVEAGKVRLDSSRLPYFEQLRHLLDRGRE